MLLPALLLCSSLAHVTLSVEPQTVLRTFDPRTAFGAGVDGHEQGDVTTMYTPESVTAMKSIGLRSLTYRLRTELGVEVWHWNNEGTWSDAGHSQGYWTSAPTSTKPLIATYGYRLPRRGDTIDQANRDDYSRLDDGDLNTFWKSNPYMDPKYTGVSYEKLPQWVVIVFPQPEKISDLEIAWGSPRATRYDVEYVTNPDADVPWITAKPTFHGGTASLTTDRFAPFTTRYLRLKLLASSGTGEGVGDARDHLGFSIREIYAGHTDAKGHFHDVIKHTKSNKTQSMIYVSSTDPWHRAVDRDPHTEQPGFDVILKMRMNQNLPMLVPTGCLYDTPDNIQNEAAWLRDHHVPLRGIELGEEPDGNWTDGEGYGLLYLQAATAIRKAMPEARLGGPSFQTTIDDYMEWPHTGPSWLQRFIKTLRDRGRLSDFSFCSFEWYPFDDVFGNPSRQLQGGAPLFRRTVNRLRRLGMAGMQWYITEYGWSAFAAKSEVEAQGGVFDFDIPLLALDEGASGSYLYGYEPTDPIQEMPGAWGNNMAFLRAGLIKMPIYWSSWLLTHRFCQATGTHKLLAVSGASSAVGAYAVRRPDGTIALALLNRSDKPITVTVTTKLKALVGDSYGRPQFEWKKVTENGRPEKSLPPIHVKLNPQAAQLPPFSVTVVGWA